MHGFIHPRGPDLGDGNSHWRDQEGNTGSAFSARTADHSNRAADHSNGTGANGRRYFSDETLDDLSEPDGRGHESAGLFGAAMDYDVDDLANDPLMALGAGVIALMLVHRAWAWYWRPQHCLPISAACCAAAAVMVWG